MCVSFTSGWCQELFDTLVQEKEQFHKDFKRLFTWSVNRFIITQFCNCISGCNSMPGDGVCEILKKYCISCFGCVFLMSVWWGKEILMVTKEERSNQYLYTFITSWTDLQFYAVTICYLKNLISNLCNPWSSDWFRISPWLKIECRPNIIINNLIWWKQIISDPDINGKSLYQSS